MASGDLSLFEPGAVVDVLVTADSGGNVPQRGEAVEIVGATRQRVEVGPLTDPANFIGHLNRTPTDFDENETYADGEVVDEAGLLLRHYVDWLYAEDVSELSPGDHVVVDEDGVRAYDDDPGTDEPNEIAGIVWNTTGNAAGTADKVAVIRHK